MAEKQVPNYGVPFVIGSYKIEATVITGYGRTRRIVVDSDHDCPTGCYAEELFDQMTIDVANMKETAIRFIEDARKQLEREDDAINKKKE